MRSAALKWGLLILILIGGFAVLENMMFPIYSGPSPWGTYQNEVEAAQAAYEDYKRDMNEDPPTKNPDFFDALDGKIKLNKLYVRFGAKRDANGKVLDP